MPFLSPSQERQSTEVKTITFHRLAYPKLTCGFSTLFLTNKGPWLPWGGLPRLLSTLWHQYPICVQLYTKPLSHYGVHHAIHLNRFTMAIRTAWKLFTLAEAIVMAGGISAAPVPVAAVGVVSSNFRLTASLLEQPFASAANSTSEPSISQPEYIKRYEMFVLRNARHVYPLVEINICSVGTFC